MPRVELGDYLDRHKPGEVLELHKTYLPKDLKDFRGSMQSFAKLERALKILQDESRAQHIPTIRAGERYVRNLNFCLNLIKQVARIPLENESDQEASRNRCRALRSRIAAEIGFGYHSQKKYSKAAGVFRRAAQEAHFPSQEVYLLSARATVEIVRGRNKEAQKCFRKAFEALRANEGAPVDPHMLRDLYDLLEFRGRTLLTEKPLFEPIWPQLEEYQQGVAPLRLEIARMFESLKGQSVATDIANLYSSATIRATCGTREGFELVMRDIAELDTRKRLWPFDRLLWVERAQHERTLTVSEDLIETVFDELEEYWSENPRDVSNSWEHQDDVFAKLISLYSRQVLLQHNEHLLKNAVERFVTDAGVGAAERNTDTLVNQWSDRFPIPFMSQVTNLATEALTMGKPGLTIQLLDLLDSYNPRDHEMNFGRSANLLQTRIVLLYAFASHDLAGSVAAIHRRLQQTPVGPELYKIADSARNISDRKLLAILSEKTSSMHDDYLHYLEATQERVTDHIAEALSRYGQAIKRVEDFHRRYFDDIPENEYDNIIQMQMDLLDSREREECIIPPLQLQSLFRREGCQVWPENWRPTTEPFF